MASSSVLGGTTRRGINSEGECFVSEHERYVVAQKFLENSERFGPESDIRTQLNLANVVFYVGSKSIFCISALGEIVEMKTG